MPLRCQDGAVNGRRRQLVLLVGDGPVLDLVALIGLTSHGGGITALGTLRNAGSILAGWAAATLVVRPQAQPAMGRLLLTSARGVSGCVFLRAAGVGRELDNSYLPFWAAALALTVTLLAPWHHLTHLLIRERPEPLGDRA